MAKIVYALKRLFCRHALRRSRVRPGELVCQRCGWRIGEA